MTVFFPLIFIAVIILILVLAAKSRRDQKTKKHEARRRFIEQYAFPALLRHKLTRAYPTLSPDQVSVILEGLREWLLLIADYPGRRFGMPSVAVDTAWHEFILMTREYERFCQDAFGQYLHHTPNQGAGSEARERDALAQTYALGPVGAIAVGGAVAGGATAAGLGLFDIDRALGIDGGHLYSNDELGELTRRHATSAGGGGDASVGVSIDAGERSGHGLDGESSGGDGGGDGGGCGGGCGSE